MDGYVASVRLLLEDICYRSGVGYLAYDAPDRAATLRYINVPLRELLAKLLRHESYSLGLRRRNPETVEVSWLWVLGDHDRVIGDRTPLIWATRTRRLRVPGSFLKAAFGDDSRVDHDQALQLLVSRIAGDSDELRRFLAADSASIARSIRSFERSEEILSRLQEREQSPRVRRKLGEIIAELRR